MQCLTRSLICRDGERKTFNMRLLLSLLSTVPEEKNGAPFGVERPGFYRRRSDSLRAEWILSSNPRAGKRFFSTPISHRGPPNLLYNGYHGSFQGVKRPGRGVDKTTPSIPEVKNEWSCTSTPRLCLCGVLGAEHVSRRVEMSQGKSHLVCDVTRIKSIFLHLRQR